jgi:hypothetical protein
MGKRLYFLFHARAEEYLSRQKPGINVSKCCYAGLVNFTNGPLDG